MKKIVIAGGGTGGHIYPAISVAEALTQISKETEIIFIGSNNRIESKLIPSKGYVFYGLKFFIPTKKLSIALIKALFSQISSFFSAYKLLKQIKPAAVFGIGGYISVPTVISARMLNIPVLLIDQNVVPGLANKFLSLFVKDIAIAFKETANYFGKAINCHLTGNPIRTDFNIDKLNLIGEITKKLGLDADRFTILVMGGSQGAQAINTAILNDLEDILNNNFQLVHLCGEKNFEEINNKTEQLRTKYQKTYHLYPYFEDMPFLLACIDLSIIRAGATTIAEMLFYKIPMILIPYPHAGGHQLPNALEVEKSGAGVIIKEKELTKGKIWGTLQILLKDQKIKQMRQNCNNLRAENAAKNVAEILLKISLSL